jgi:hypothetical protein
MVEARREPGGSRRAPCILGECARLLSVDGTLPTRFSPPSRKQKLARK